MADYLLVQALPGYCAAVQLAYDTGYRTARVWAASMARVGEDLEQRSPADAFENQRDCPCFLTPSHHVLGEGAVCFAVANEEPAESLQPSTQLGMSSFNQKVEESVG